MSKRSFVAIVALLGLLVGANARSQTIVTVVGGGPNNLPALESGIFPHAIALDAAGNLYILSRFDERAYKVDPSGNLTVFAGTGGTGQVFSDPPFEGVPATSLNMRAPLGIAADPSGDVFLADTQFGRIRRVDVATGLVSTYAGDGGIGFAGDGGPATSARLNNAAGIEFDALGNLFIADNNNHRIRKVDGATGNISTIAGSGSTTFSDGSALAAGVPFPEDVGVDGSGRVFFLTGSRVRRLATGFVSTVAGTGFSGFSGDGGSATVAQINQPNFLAVRSTGDFVLSDRDNHRIRAVVSGVIDTVAGDGTQSFSGDGGPATSASMNTPEGIAVDGAGNIFFVDSLNRRIRRVDAATSTITTYAGNGSFGFSGEGAPAVDASLRLPLGVAPDPAGNLYVADDNNNRIRKVDASSGLITTLTGNGFVGNTGNGGPAVNAVINSPHDVALDSAGNIFFADFGNNQVRRIDASTGIITKFAGTLSGGFTGDGGPAVNASLNHPSGLAFDSADNLFIADTSNNRIRRIDASTGIITTVAGGGAGGDGIPATSSRLFGPGDVALDGAGNLFIADTSNHRIRRVDASTGIIATVAGTGTAGALGEGGPATSAQLNQPTDVEVDSAGNLYIADKSNYQVRAVDSMGIIRRIAGTSCCFRGEGGLPLSAAFDLPQKVTLDGMGHLLVSDTENHRIRSMELSTDLGITKTDGLTTVPAGGAVTYTITVANNGPLTVDAVTVVDTLASELLSPLFTPSEGSYDDGTGAWTGISLAPGGSVTLTLEATVDMAATGTVVNSVAVSPAGGLVDPVPGNDTASDTDTVVPPADLSITKTSMPEPVVAGGLLTYQVDIVNNGPGSASSVVLTDPLPAAVSFVSVTPTPTCGEAGGVVSCNFGTLSSGANAAATIVVRTSANGIVENAATVSSPEDALLTNNSASVSSTVGSGTDALVAFTITATDRKNVLQWVNPVSASYGTTHIVVRNDRYPTDCSDGTDVLVDGTAGPGGKGSFPHGALNNDETLYYAACVNLLPTGVSAPRFAKGRPFDNVTGPVKWAYTTGAAALAPPGIGPAIYGNSNDGLFHAIAPGPAGGEWPTTPVEWKPVDLGAPLAQARIPVVPTMNVTGAPARVAFVSTQDGRVNALDAETGAFLWPGTDLAQTVNAAPAGIFADYGSLLNYILIGTRSAAGSNRFVALRTDDGSLVDAFDNGGPPSDIGIISGSAAVDYDNMRVFFASRAGGSSSTVWCLNIIAGGFSFGWEAAIGDVDGSPVLYNGKLFVGTNAGKVYALDPATGATKWSWTPPTPDGGVKGFVWPQRGSNLLFFSTMSRVVSLSYDDTSAALEWMASVSAPSVPLLTRNYLLVGSGDGTLKQFDLSTSPPASPLFVTLGDGGAVVGSPSLDIRDDMLYVGTDDSIVYAVKVPLVP